MEYLGTLGSFALVMGAVTFATRLLPFVLLGKRQRAPWLEFLGAFLPPAIMMLLVCYALKDLSLQQEAKLIASLLGVVAVVLLHRQWRNALLSILGGTGLHMLVLQYLSA